MTEILIGCGQITWSGVPEEQVLAEIAQAGYLGAPAGPRPGRSPAATTALYAGYGLQPAPGYFGAAFWRADQHAQILEQAREQASFAAALGLTELYVAPTGFDYVTASGKTRRDVAGHVGPGDGLSHEEYAHFAETLNAVGAITRAEGVWSCFHNHVGTVIETGAEIARLLELLDPEAVALGPDTGHLEWAGVNALEFCRSHIARIRTLHIKDIDPGVRERGRAAGWDYGTFAAAGIFIELGQGCVDFPALFALLRAADFAGWAIAETDVTQLPSALESATVSRAYLRSIGL